MFTNHPDTTSSFCQCKDTETAVASTEHRKHRYRKCSTAVIFLMIQVCEGDFQLQVLKQCS